MNAGQLAGKVVTPDDQRYPRLRSTYTTVARPAYVVLPESTSDIAAALRFAREEGLAVAVRSGGHGLSGSGSNNGGLVIDLSALNQTDILDRRARLVRVEAGARWGQVAAALAPAGLAISSGDHGNVGVGGLATGGGVGWLVRHYGLTIDHIRAVELVLADGSLVRADADNEPELFWAVRGAGAGVGIVVSFEIEAIEVRDVGYAQIVIEVDPAGEVLRRWSDYLTVAPRELSTAMFLFSQGRSVAASITAVVASDRESRIRAAVEPLLGLGRLLDQQAQIVPYQALVPTRQLHPNTGQQPSLSTNGLLTEMTAEPARALVSAASGPQPLLIQLRSVGGAVNDVSDTATAYAHRHQQTLVIASAFPPHDSDWLASAWRRVGRHTDGSYVNFESTPSADTFARAYPGATGERVRGLWRRYDPDAILGRR